MKRQKRFLSGIATLLLAIAPGLINPTASAFFLLGEPELPAKYRD